MTDEDRPELTPDMTAEEFQRWYWMKNEVTHFASQLGLRASGSKQQVASRISRRLSGATISEANGPQPKKSVDLLTGTLTPETKIPEGQRITAHLRAFMALQCGPDFRFDGHMREFFAQGGDITLGDAVQRWKETRDAPARPIESQFEWNTFVRAYRLEHPTASHEAVAQAWQRYRSLPKDKRPPVADA